MVLARLRLLTDTDYMAGWSGGKKQTSRHTSRNYQAIVWPAHHHINIPSWEINIRDTISSLSLSLSTWSIMIQFKLIDGSVSMPFQMFFFFFIKE